MLFDDDLFAAVDVDAFLGGLRDLLAVEGEPAVVIGIGIIGGGSAFNLDGLDARGIGGAKRNLGC